MQIHRRCPTAVHLINSRKFSSSFSIFCSSSSPSNPSISINAVQPRRMQQQLLFGGSPKQQKNRRPTKGIVQQQQLPTMILLFASIIFCCCLTGSNAAADIAVKIERHFPCSPASGPNKDQLRIKFPSYKSTGVNFKEEKDQEGHKCFHMSGGKVEVYPPGLDGSKKYYVHVETRIGIHGKPERCVNPDKENCGGIGSCVHCDICQQKGGSLRNFIQIFKGDKPAECTAEGLPAGTYDDLALRVCLPSKEELLPFLDQNSSRAEQLWDIFVSSRARSGGEIPLVIAARIFDRPINKMSIKELNDALHQGKQGMIGCHWIYATVKSIGQ